MLPEHFFQSHKGQRWHPHEGGDQQHSHAGGWRNERQVPGRFADCFFVGRLVAFWHRMTLAKIHVCYPRPCWFLVYIFNLQCFMDQSYILLKGQDILPTYTMSQRYRPEDYTAFFINVSSFGGWQHLMMIAADRFGLTCGQTCTFHVPRLG